MQRAVELSLNNELNYPFGAVILSGEGKVVGEGKNVVNETNDPTAHAEVVAIRDACRNIRAVQLVGCTIYSSCEPCPMCLCAIYWAGIDKVVYGNSREDAARFGFEDDYLYKEMKLSIDERKVEMLQDKAFEPIKAFEEWADRNIKAVTKTDNV